jgi:aromatic-L-amino-acid/L-tryptophan decarboxylase
MQENSHLNNLIPEFGDMPKEDFRKFGYEMIDFIANYFENLDDFPVLSQNAPNDLKNALPLSIPKTGEDFSDIFADVEKLILPAVTHWNHPNFHGLFSTSTSSVGIFAEMLSATFDMKAMLWRTSPASTELEEVVLDWLRQMMTLPESFRGVIYDTASISTLHAVAMAREKLNLDIRKRGMSGRTDLPLLRIYCSEQTHSSIDKAVILLGLGTDSIVKIPVNNKFEMNTDELSTAILADIALGYLPFCVVATVGTTSTTSVDDVEKISQICQTHNLWLHVDAAYAGSAMIVPELQHHFRGAEKADSIVTNPHKWLFTPFDLSVLYVRDLDLLKQTFSLVAEYLKVTEAVNNQMDYGIQLGRRFRSLKLWFVLRYFGQEGLISRIREHCRLAKLLETWVNESDDFEMMADVPFALVCFRAISKDVENLDLLNILNETLMNNINASGKAYISPTKLHGKITLRVSIGSIHIEEKHIENLWNILNSELSLLNS